MLRLKPGQVSIKDQAAVIGEPVPVGCTVEELRQRGYIVEGPPMAKLLPSTDSETGYVISTNTLYYEQVSIWSLGG